MIRLKQASPATILASVFVVALGVFFFLNAARYWVMGLLFCLPIFIGLGIGQDSSRKRAVWANRIFILVGVLGIAQAMFELFLRQYLGSAISIYTVQIRVDRLLGLWNGTMLGLILALLLSGELCGRPLKSDQMKSYCAAAK